MRFGIIGTGAIGGLFAGYLCANGEEVCCFDADEEIVSSIEKTGLRVERPDREDLCVHPEISTASADLGTVDVAFLMTKSFDTETALADADPMLGPETRILTVQNGLYNLELIGGHVPDERLLGGYTLTGSNTVEPGRVRQLMDGKTVIGGTDTETAGAVADRLTAAGIETTAVEDPEPHIWDKQFMNAAIKPIAALTELRNGPMVEHEETRDAMRRLIEEAVAVARAKGVEILADDPVGDVLDREMSEANAEKKSSILEDVENERPTEIEHINGAVVAFGEEHGVETPYNRLATQLVSGKERSYLE
jgi:2-dehydropantoate 2-reductase